MEVVNYVKKEYPVKILDMIPTYSIGELNNGYENEIVIRSELMLIMAKWLSLNIKSKSINTDEGLMLVIDYILEDCSNLELQEVNFIFRNGVMGKFGVIYNDISIDTICGKEGWIESYYKDFRKFKKDKIECEDSSIKLTGKEMTLEEFHAKNPDLKNRYSLNQIYIKAKEFKISIEDAKMFYKIKGLSLDDFKDDCEYFCILWNKSSKVVPEIEYIKECFRRFILENIFKTKIQ